MAGVHNAEFVDIIVDGGESAKSLNRPGMERLLAHQCCRVPGYRLAADGVHVEPEPTEPANGMSLRRIAKDLDRRGMRTCKGSEWRLESMARVACANTRLIG
jgi:hypothetical protein